MATTNQIISLIKAHNENNNEKFKTVILQIAAYESKHNHKKIADDLKKYAEQVNQHRSNILGFNNTPINPLVYLSIEKHKLNELIVSEDIYIRINKILNEYNNKSN